MAQPLKAILTYKNGMQAWWWWWYTPLISSLRFRDRQFETSLVYRACSSQGYPEKLCLKNKKNNKRLFT